MATTDLVVVGGGLAGLGAAALAARGGCRVTLLEKASALGGRASTQEKHGFAMNLGAHALYLDGAARRVVEGLGVSTAGKPPPVSGGLALRGDTLHTLPSGFVSLLSTGLFDLRAKLEFGGLLAKATRLDTRPFDGISARAWLEQSLESEVVRETVAMLFRVATYAADMDRLSAGAALAQLKLAAGAGVRYLDGGWQTLVAGLRAAAIASGVSIRTGAKAVRVALEGGAVRGVALDDGTIFEASSVILAVSPGAAASLAPGVDELARASSSARPVRAACLDLGLSRLPRPHAIVAFGVDRPVYFSVHSASARLAPEGAALVHVAKYLRDGDESDAEAELEALMERVQPGYREHVVERRFLPSLIVTNALVTAEAGGLTGRPGVEIPSARGLFIAGDWVGPDGMLADAALASAEQAAALVVGGRGEARRAA